MKLWILALPIVYGVACSSSSTLDPFSIAGSNCPYHVYHHDPNGWLLTEPEVHLDFWGNWNQWSDAIGITQPDTFLYDWYSLLNQDGVMQRLAEYGIHEGTLDITAYYNPGPTVIDGVDAGGSSVLDDTTFAATLGNEIQTGSLPYPNSNTLYVVLLPPNVTTSKIVTNQWDGYHASSSYAGQAYAYAIVRYSGKLATTSHEIYEAATNPGGSGFFDDASGNEIGDLCQPNSETINGYTVQKVWSQSLCSCF